jgi:aspartyl protease family protein
MVRIKKLCFFYPLIFFSCLFISCNNSPRGKYLSVTAILNGNTIQLRNGSTIILLGIYDSPTAYKFLSSRLLGHKVAVFFDKRGKSPSSVKNGIYYAYVLTENKSCINSEMLKSGVAQYCADYLGDSLIIFNKYAQYAGGNEPPSGPSSKVNSSSPGNSNITTIRMTEQNGVYEVPIEVNDVPLNFIFDTGASSISISATEAQILLENGKISKDDFEGNENFTDATGRVSEGTILRLRRVKIGDKTIEDVEASVIDSPDAPLLLGQTAMQRFGKITIDYNNQVIYLQ